MEEFFKLCLTPKGMKSTDNYMDACLYRANSPGNSVLVKDEKADL